MTTKTALNCLHEFSYPQFVGYVEEELKLDDWVIWNAPSQVRLDCLDYTNYGTNDGKLYYQILQQEALESNIQAEPSEIISWIDTLRLLYETLLLVPQKILDEIKIIQEYKIPYSNRRADYLLVHKNRILIVEFSLENNEDSKYENKLQQVVGYKEMLGVLCPRNIEIATYVYLIKYESNFPYNKLEKINKYTLQREPVNNSKSFEMAQYIRIFFTKENVDKSYTQLNFLNADEKYSR